MVERDPLTLAAAGRRLRDGDFTSRDLTHALLSRSDAIDGELGAWQLRFDEQALRTAERADAELARGRDRGPLHGIPFGVKDIIAVADGPTTAGSLAFDDEWGRGRDAPVVRRLRDAGAVIVGKTTTIEFAFGGPDPSKPFPIPRNPWDPRSWAGGSSSGSGSSVAAGLSLAALGTDTGGSIRIPAAYCGVSGIIPTFGLVPKSGCVPLAVSLDRIGPLARTAEDCALVLDAIAGFAPSDPNSVSGHEADRAADLEASIDGIRVGIVRAGHFPDRADPSLAPCFEAAVEVIEGLGASVREVTLPLYKEMLVATIVTIASEAFAFHRRRLQERWSDYSSGARKGFAEGAFVTGADYVQAQRARARAQREVAEIFTEVDVILAPTAATGALPVDFFGDGPLSEIDELFQDLSDLFEVLFTPYWNCVGSPALAVPIGFTKAGLPLSMQVVARPFEDARALNVGHQYQKATDWHRRVPPLAIKAREDETDFGY